MQLIREFSPEQLSWRNDPETRLSTRQSGIISKEQHEKWVASLPNRTDCIYFGLEIEVPKVAGFKRKPEIIGYVGLDKMHDDPAKQHRTAEYSILIGPPYQKKGHGREALKLLLDYAFKTLDLHLVFGEILKTNEGGLKLALSVGFKEEGTLRERYYKNGQRVDSVMVSIKRDEWLQQS